MMFELLFSELFFTVLFAMSAYHSIILFFCKSLYIVLFVCSIVVFIYLIYFSCLIFYTRNIVQWKVFYIFVAKIKEMIYFSFVFIRR